MQKNAKLQTECETNSTLTIDSYVLDDSNLWRCTTEKDKNVLLTKCEKCKVANSLPQV